MTVTNSPETRSINPATEEVLAVWPMLDREALEARLARAQLAYSAWRSTSPSDRAVAMTRLGEVLRSRVDSLSAWITSEMGKPNARARGEVLKCATLCDWYAARGPALLVDQPIDLGTDGVATIRHEPLGVILGVMPWNFPLWQVLRAAIPITMAGNAFVLKHADNVQGSANAIEAAFGKAGFPEGLFANLNVHHSTLPDLLADWRVAGVSVTAGVGAGAVIAAEAGRNLKKSVLELGGSDPFIVLADADLDRVIPAAIEARFQNSGQVCIAGKRIIVEQAIAENFIARFNDAAAALSVGDPFDPTVHIGPLARHRLRDELHSQVERSVDMGARVLLGGTMPEGPGAFYPVTVLADVSPDMPVFREETFGPVAALIVARDADHAIELANTSDFGLSGSIWTSDATLAQSLARRVETGGLFINKVPVSDPRVPIGGIRHSGYGRELSHFGLQEFSNIKLIWAAQQA